MEPYQQDFIRFALESGALRFGRYTLKSGRVSPYFFNAGLFDTGRCIARLGRCYAAAIVHSGFDADMLFGPAYKGIPLVTATAAALAEHHARDLPYAFNRKEAKDHGEGGNVVGAPLAGRVLIVDDVITSGLVCPWRSRWRSSAPPAPRRPAWSSPSTARNADAPDLRRSRRCSPATTSRW